MFLILAFLILSFLIFFHELGHFVVARFFGVGVEVFSIGFGKKIIKTTYKGTEYAVSLIPLGGYVQLKGQGNLEAQNITKDCFNAKSPLVRIAILLAGPLFNFILAFIIYVCLVSIGIRGVLPIIGSVQEGMPAHKAGILPDDKILKINKKNIYSWNDVVDAIEGSKRLSLEIMRGEEQLYFFIQPEKIKKKNLFNEIVNKEAIGITAKGEVGILRYKILDSFRYGFFQVYQSANLILMGVQKIFTGIVPFKDIGGPIMIVNSIAEFAQKGIVVLLFWVALISVNLGVLNLLPIPALDGGQILFNIYEFLTQKPLNRFGVTILMWIGWLILIALMLLGISNDLSRIITHG